MKLLIVTQKIDINDSLLGFFHRWVEEFSKHYERVIVIALGVEEYHLPENVKVLSLGKEKLSVDNQWSIVCKIKYLFKFYKYIWQERKNYDSVFIHMNQEYVLLAAKLWWLMGKKIMLWRNHPKGNLLTNLAVLLSDRVFCTSKYSYTAKFKKTEIMPVGIDTELFKRNININKLKNSILSLGRIAPVKNIDLLIEALNILNKEGFSFNAVIIGDVAHKDKQYYELIKNKVKEYGLEKMIDFRRAVIPKEVVNVYNDYDLFVNLTLTGSMDKTIFEAMACETLVLTSNRSLKGSIDNSFLVDENNIVQLASKIKEAISLRDIEKDKLGKELRNFVIENHSLKKLMEKI